MSLGSLDQTFMQLGLGVYAAGLGVFAYMVIGLNLKYVPDPPNTDYHFKYSTCIAYFLFCLELILTKYG